MATMSVGGHTVHFNGRQDMPSPLLHKEESLQSFIEELAGYSSLGTIVWLLVGEGDSEVDHRGYFLLKWDASNSDECKEFINDEVFKGDTVLLIGIGENFTPVSYYSYKVE